MKFFRPIIFILPLLLYDVNVLLPILSESFDYVNLKNVLFKSFKKICHD